MKKNYISFSYLRQDLESVFLFTFQAAKYLHANFSTAVESLVRVVFSRLTASFQINVDCYCFACCGIPDRTGGVMYCQDCPSLKASVARFAVVRLFACRIVSFGQGHGFGSLLS